MYKLRRPTSSDGLCMWTPKKGSGGKPRNRSKHAPSVTDYPPIPVVTPADINRTSVSTGGPARLYSTALKNGRPSNDARQKTANKEAPRTKKAEKSPVNHADGNIDRKIASLVAKAIEEQVNPLLSRMDRALAIMEANASTHGNTTEVATSQTEERLSKMEDQLWRIEQHLGRLTTPRHEQSPPTCPSTAHEHHEAAPAYAKMQPSAPLYLEQNVYNPQQNQQSKSDPLLSTYPPHRSGMSGRTTYQAGHPHSQLNPPIQTDSNQEENGQHQHNGTTFYSAWAPHAQLGHQIISNGPPLHHTTTQQNLILHGQPVHHIAPQYAPTTPSLQPQHMYITQ
jgi:hypothetical protein